MVRRAARVDQNHAEVVDALRKAGCSVVSLAAIGKGCPDLLAARSGRTVLLEVKLPKGKLNDEQSDFHAAWLGEIATVRSAEEAIAVMSRPGAYTRLSAGAYA